MPVELLSAAERDRLSRLPPEIPREDLAAHFRLTHFRLTHDDRAVIDRLRGGHNRLGFALQLAAVRYLGFVPADLDAVPREALRYLAEQVGTEPEALKDYGTRPKTVRTHLQAVLDYLRFRRAAPFFDFLDKRYAYVRQFAPAFLEVMPLRSNPGDDPVMEAVEVLRELNREGRRKVPHDVPEQFVPKPWKPFVFDRTVSADGSISRKDQVNRHGWEFCVLSELRGRLRSGDIFAEPSSRYADPETYLIEQEAWPRLRQEACEQLGLTATGRDLAGGLATGGVAAHREQVA